MEYMYKPPRARTLALVFLLSAGASTAFVHTAHTHAKREVKLAKAELKATQVWKREKLLEADKNIAHCVRKFEERIPGGSSRDEMILSAGGLLDFCLETANGARRNIID